MAGIPAFVISLVGSLCVLVPMTVCYHLATSLGHKPHWPYTDITNTGIRYPQQVIFIALFTFGAVFLYLSNEIKALDSGSFAKAEKSQEGLLGPAPQAAIPSYYKRVNLAFFVFYILNFVSISYGDMSWPLHVLGANLIFVTTAVIQLILRRRLQPDSSLYSRFVFYYPHFAAFSLLLQVVGKLINAKEMAVAEVLMVIYLLLTELALTIHLKQRGLRLYFKPDGSLQLKAKTQ